LCFAYCRGLSLVEVEVDAELTRIEAEALETANLFSVAAREKECQILELCYSIVIILSG
jgi:hypothetical protein